MQSYMPWTDASLQHSSRGPGCCGGRGQLGFYTQRQSCLTQAVADTAQTQAGRTSGKKINQRSLRITGAELSSLQSQEHSDLVESQIRPRGDSLQSPHTPRNKPKGANPAMVESLRYTTTETSFGVPGQRNPLHKAPPTSSTKQVNAASQGENQSISARGHRFSEGLSSGGLDVERVQRVLRALAPRPRTQG